MPLGAQRVIVSESGESMSIAEVCATTSGQPFFARMEMH